jgi:L-rhamnose-H+ transport protein
MNTFTIALIIIVVSGFFQGTFGLGMRKFAPLSWEAFWLLFSVFGMIIIPFIWTSSAVPNVLNLVAKVPSSNLIMAIIYGALWGVGAIMYGLTMNYLGVSLGNGITMGLASAVGTMVPLFQIPDYSSRTSFPLIIVGVVIMITGIAILTIAGIKRDKIRESSGEGNVNDIKQGKQFYLGVIMAVLCGILGAFANIGFNYARVVSDVAVAKGIEPRNASLSAWMVVFWGNFIVNIIYSVYLIFKNKSLKTFSCKGAAKGIIWAILTGFMWYAALALYGQGAALIGEIGTVIGWTMFLSLALVISNVWGIAFGEWKNAKKPLNVLLIGNLILIISFIFLGYANTL